MLVSSTMFCQHLSKCWIIFFSIFLKLLPTFLRNVATFLRNDGFINYFLLTFLEMLDNTFSKKNQHL
jgi:hypothetical protein